MNSAIRIPQGPSRTTITDRSTRRDRRPRRAGRSPEEGRRDTRVDRDVQTGRLAQVAGGQGEDRRSDVLRQDLALEQRSLSVELAELVLGDTVGPGAIRSPTLREDARTTDDAIGVHAVDAYPVLAELGGEQSDLVRLVGLGRSVRDIVRAGEEGVLADDIDEVAAHRLVDEDACRLTRDEERSAGHHIVLEVPVTDCRLEEGLRDR